VAQDSLKRTSRQPNRIDPNWGFPLKRAIGWCFCRWDVHRRRHTRYHQELHPSFPKQAPLGIAGGWRAIVLLAAVLRLWRLNDNGYGNQYYAAGVRSMLQNWHNFFFDAFDPNGFVSLDKPPAAFWIQVASAKLLGFSGVSVLLPQALEGTAAVGLLYLLVRRRFGPREGLLAALFLAITPIAVAADRSNNTDSCLVLVLLLACWSFVRAAKAGSRPFLLAAAALVGVAFNVKMLAAFIVLPTFVLAYFLSAPLYRSRRIIDLILSVAVIAVVSSAWILVFDLTPPNRRPFAGSSSNNSMLELALGHNGLQRFKSLGSTNAGPKQEGVEALLPASGVAITRVPPGPVRLLNPLLADQFGWLLPLALFGLGVWVRRAWAESQLFLDPDLIVWAGWTVMYAVVYSSVRSLSSYYLVTLSPPLCALAGFGATSLCSRLKAGGGRQLAIAASVLLSTAAWQVYIERGYLLARLEQMPDNLVGPEEWTHALSVAVLAGTMLALTGPLLARRLRLRQPRLNHWAIGSFCVALIAVLVNPLAWSLSGMFGSGHAARPQADPFAQSMSPGVRGSREEKLIAFLKANYQGERFFLATLTARLAAPIIVQTGEPVAALGGFSGADPIVSQDVLAKMVAGRQLRFVITGGLRGFGAFPGAQEHLAALSDWLKVHGTPVAPSLWRSPATDNQLNNAVARARRRPFGARANATPIELYDLTPRARLRP
jgi:4-amino-4-deoxy-L-arabinose transferase-like glycosyltransferase